MIIATLQIKGAYLFTPIVKTIAILYAIMMMFFHDIVRCYHLWG